MLPLTAEIADTPQASENGLMFRDSLPEDRGMLFVFVAAEEGLVLDEKYEDPALDRLRRLGWKNS